MPSTACVPWVLPNSLGVKKQPEARKEDRDMLGAGGGDEGRIFRAQTNPTDSLPSSTETWQWKGLGGTRQQRPQKDMHNDTPQQHIVCMWWDLSYSDSTA